MPKDEATPASRQAACASKLLANPVTEDFEIASVTRIMKFGIVTFPGSNCDYDAYRAVVEALGEEGGVSLAQGSRPPGQRRVILPGGFSYGDYLRAGAIARFSPIMREVVAHAERGGPVLAICNGFQIACEAGLLPGALLRNASLKFVCAPIGLRVENADTLFTSRLRTRTAHQLPIAHGDGRYSADDVTLDDLEGEGHVVFRYAPDPLQARRRTIRTARCATSRESSTARAMCSA